MWYLGAVVRFSLLDNRIDFQRILIRFRIVSYDFFPNNMATKYLDRGFLRNEVGT